MPVVRSIPSHRLPSCRRLAAAPLLPARLLVVAGFVFSAALPTHAAERITLLSGFTVDCLRHEPATTTGHTRLLLAGGSDNTLELPTASIQAIDSIPDPPSAAAPASAPASPHAPQTLQPLLVAAEQLHHVDRDLLASVVRAESAGNAHAVSRTGARGLMQLMPATAATLGVHDSFAPEQNIDGGSSYLDQLLTRYHDNIALALAAYNAGPGAVDRFHGIPPFRETRVYVARVIREFNRRKLTPQPGLPDSPPAAAASTLAAARTPTLR